MSMEILEQYWTEIIERVVKPLWNTDFASMYKSKRLDYDDFESMAGLELTKAFKAFDANKSNVLTFATNVIKKKARTELRDAGRDRRRAFSESDSLNVPMADDSKTEIIATLVSPVKTENSLLSEKRVSSFVKGLSNRQLRELILQLLCFEDDEICEMLGIDNKQYLDDIKEMRNFRNSKYLTQRGGFDK